MTLSSSLSNALSGLTAASRAAEVVSSNIANAMTEGYARREIQLSSRSLDGSGAGVTIEGVLRLVDSRTLSDRRQAEAAVAESAASADAWTRIESAIGLPGDSGSLTDRINAFESALLSAASRPDESSRLDQAAAAAVSLADGINAVSNELQSMRMDADSDIANMVERLNSGLTRVEELNRRISDLSLQGRDASSLLDERQRIVDGISRIVPVQQIPRDRGQISLYTTGGGILLDGTAAEFGFQQTGTITPYMSVDDGALSGLTLNGNALRIGGTHDPVAGGELAAAFTIRDEIAPGIQVGLDAMARDLIERFQDPGLDATVASAGAGLFTDGNTAFDVADELGLAARISVNSAVDPAGAGESWRLRDGIGAGAAGQSGNATLLQACAERLAEDRIAVSGLSAGLSRSAAELVSDILSTASTGQIAAEDDQAFQRARYDALAVKEAENGVDSDDELQKLLLIEQAYAANARMMQAIDQMMQQLLEI
ncbi:flagellar hook-associated protein FlgK [Tropicimonas sp.]|uniref:flagellar hook-associated protein FlgK n=1 Tax=Tropicimonas sp. TaxID=2067044 RepID=UPI003A8643E6